jgi:hypothetical protein
MQVKVSMSGGSFELETGWPWTAGLSPFRHKEQFNIRWCQETKRHLFDMKGKTYSAKQISPQITGIETYRTY